jgi:hypothetical protein
MGEEAKLWRIDWKRARNAYLVFVVGNNEVRATAKSIEDALELLEEAIATKCGDPSPRFEFVTPLPDSLDLEARDFLFTLAGHQRSDVINSEILFERPRCQRCGNVYGPRSQALISLSEAPAAELTFTEFGRIISKRLVAFLRLERLNEFSLLPVLIAGRETGDYFELRSIIAREFVARRNTPARSAFRCRECGFSMVVYLPDEAKYFQYVAAASLPKPVPQIFALGVDYGAAIAISGTLRRELIGSSGFMDIVTRKVGILGDDQAMPASEFFPKPLRRQ